MNAFFNAGPNVVITKIPNGLAELNSGVFEYCPNVKISEFGSNDGSSQLWYIGPRALSNTANGSVGAPLTSITIYKSVNTIGTNAFSSCASNTLETVYFSQAEGGYNGVSPSEMGFTKVENIVWGYTD